MKSVFIRTIVVLATITLLISGCASVNHPPIISSLIADKGQVAPSGSCEVECIASDSNGNELDYDWEASGGYISANSPKVTWVAPEEPGEYIISVNVTDEDGNKATRSITISVKGNQPPQINSLKSSSGQVVPLGNCTVTCEASYSDGDELTYTWSVSGGDISGSDSTVIWTAPEAVGTYTIAVKVTDGKGGEDTSALNINVSHNDVLIIEDLVVTAEHKYFKEAPGGYKILQGRSCDINCVASDPYSDALHYEWAHDGGNISGEGSMVTWTAPLRGGEFTVTVTVSDGHGGVATKSVVLQVETCAPCEFE